MNHSPFDELPGEMASHVMSFMTDWELCESLIGTSKTSAVYVIWELTHRQRITPDNNRRSGLLKVLNYYNGVRDDDDDLQFQMDGLFLTGAERMALQMSRG
jgi:hypothetical protein